MGESLGVGRIFPEKDTILVTGILVTTCKNTQNTSFNK